jgi:hypothetical protein
MSTTADPNLNRCWLWPAGECPAPGQLLELYRDYLALLARLQIGRRLQ